MNKSDYLNQLKNELNNLVGTIPQSDIEDIIRDQDEYFREAIHSGRNEQSVIDSLGSAADLAKELKVEYQIKNAANENKVIPKTKNIFKAILALCVLAPFNLIFVLGPFLGLCGTLFGFWSADLGIFLAGLAVVALGMILIFAINPVVGMIGIFSGLSIMGVSVLFGCAMYYITRWFLKLTISFLKWNINFIKNSTSEAR